MSGGNTAVRRIFAVVLIIAAVGCGYLALRGDDAPAATTDTPRLATPLWSPRRVPQPTRRRGGGAAAPVASRRRAGRRSELRGGERRLGRHRVAQPQSRSRAGVDREAPHRLGRDERAGVRLQVRDEGRGTRRPDERNRRSVVARRRGRSLAQHARLPGDGRVEPAAEHRGAGDRSEQVHHVARRAGRCHRCGRGAQHPGRHPGRRLALRGGALPAVLAGHVPHRPRDRPDRRTDREPRHERDPTEAHGGGRSGGVRGDAARRPAARHAACRSARPGGPRRRRVPSRSRPCSRRRSAISWARRSSPATTSRWRCSPGRLASRSQTRAPPPPARRRSSTRSTSSASRSTGSRSSTGRASTAAIACRARR